jgi:transposase
MREEVSTVELLVPRCAGLDVAKDEVVACIRVPDGQGGRRQEVRTFPTFTSGLEGLADWLTAEGVTQVVMEATGQSWKPAWYVLEEAGFQLLLVNARHVKLLPGRKTDVGDAAWLAELLEHGLLRGSFVPPAAIRQLRDLTRYRKRLIQTHSAECQRIQKTLEDAGIKLDSVAADVLGVSGRAMLAALVGGERDPEVLAELARGRLRTKLPQLRQALRGRFSDHHALLVGLSLAHLEHLEGAIAALDTEVDQVISPFARPGTSWIPSPGWASGPPRRSSPRSASTWRCSPPPRTWRRGLGAARATTSPGASAARAGPPRATAGWARC